MEKKKNLESEIKSISKLPCLISLVISVVYVAVTTRLQLDQLAPLAISAAVIYLIAFVAILPIAISNFVKDISDEHEMTMKGETTELQRTVLLKKIMLIPEKVGVKFLAVVLGSGLFWVLCSTFFFKVSNDNLLMLLSALFIGAYSGFVLIFSNSQKISSKFAVDLVTLGVDKREVEERHYFGTISTKITVFHIFAPILIINVFFVIMSINVLGNLKNEPGLYVVIRLAIICILNLIFYCFFSTSLFKRMMRSILQMSEILSSINKDNMGKVKPEPTDLSNEFMYNIYLINTIVDLLQGILKLSSHISMDVVESSNELSVISKETAVTSLEQASGIKELLSAMEESDALARNISEKISEVSLVAKKSTEDINGGFDILKQNMQKLEEIKQANEITVEGIKTLTEKISGISDIAGIINSIADQTNIIAFNAELEATAAGDTGDNFHNVANEIRRLTNNTIQSTNEIRERITEIQHSSELLLASSGAGSEKIIAGNELINSLHDSFTELQESSESTDSAANEIKQIISQQTASFEQIVITLRQIADAAENFSVSTQKISSSAENLCGISEELKKFQPEEISNQEDIDAMIAYQNAKTLRKEAAETTAAIAKGDLSSISMEVENVK